MSTLPTESSPHPSWSRLHSRTRVTQTRTVKISKHGPYRAKGEQLQHDVARETWDRRGPEQSTHSGAFLEKLTKDMRKTMEWNLIYLWWGCGGEGHMGNAMECHRLSQIKDTEHLLLWVGKKRRQLGFQAGDVKCSFQWKTWWLFSALLWLVHSKGLMRRVCRPLPPPSLKLVSTIFLFWCWAGTTLWLAVTTEETINKAKPNQQQTTCP